MSRPADWNVLLESARQIVASGAIQLVKRSAARLPHSAEAMALTISALGALNRYTGVRTLNLDLDGRPVALAIIEDAVFDRDVEGNTVLENPTRNDP
ncbi:hypothetical protein ANAEL_00608 [Anaerolineales bacterium]|nr:hypothetical protein ANAEL_00608 [Anaerolineales bacterium]